MEIISRKEAKARGLTRYFTGRPCKNGHIAEHRVSGACVECLRIKKRTTEYKAQQRKYKVSREKRNASNDKWRRNGGQAIKTQLQRKRRARKRSAEGKHTEQDILDILKAQKYRCAYCRKSIRQKYEPDHIKPLSRGGSDDKRNIQALCPTCNRKKHARESLLFARDFGMLL